MLRLAAVFGEHMVLQRGKPVAVWGEADGPVEVCLAGHRARADCERGRFLAHLPPMEAGGPYDMTVRRGGETVRLGDVRVGEVWLCGGQSNMEFRLRDERHADEANRLREPRVRFYEVPHAATVREAEALEREAKWQVLEPGACGDVSAAAFYAARALCERLGVAVGMIICCVGGTSASCWMSGETLSRFPEGRAYLTDFEARVRGKSDEQFERENAAYQKKADAFNAAVAQIRREKPDAAWSEITARLGDFPWPPPDGRTMLRRPAGPFETMLVRVAPYALRGFLFYQGEQDAATAWVRGYAKLFRALIDAWRALFADETLWFIAAQLPRFGADPGQEDWGALRAAQQEAIDAARHAALACLIDCGERDNVHPTDKRTPGERLAALALAHAYGEDVRADAPRVTSAHLSADRSALALRTTGGALVMRENARDSLCVEGARLQDVSVRADAVILRLADAGPRVRVRYAQENWPEVAFFGENGLPLFPFDVAACDEP